MKIYTFVFSIKIRIFVLKQGSFTFRYAVSFLLLFWEGGAINKKLFTENISGAPVRMSWLVKSVKNL